MWLVDPCGANQSPSSARVAYWAVRVSQRRAMMLDPATSREIRDALAKVNALKTVSPSKPRLSRTDVETMTAALNGSLRGRRDAALVWLIWEGRMNRSQVVSLRWRHVVFDEFSATVKIIGRSTRDVRLVTLHEGEEPLIALLAWCDARRRRDDEPVFTSIPWNGRRVSSVPLSTNDVSRIVRRRSLEAGLGPANARSLIRLC